LDTWLQRLDEIITNRNGFLQRIEINEQERKIACLQNTDLEQSHQSGGFVNFKIKLKCGTYIS